MLSSNDSFNIKPSNDPNMSSIFVFRVAMRFSHLSKFREQVKGLLVGEDLRWALWRWKGITTKDKFTNPIS